jgi:hypothetical protein
MPPTERSPEDDRPDSPPPDRSDEGAEVAIESADDPDEEEKAEENVREPDEEVLGMVNVVD